jgi:thioredoxin-related protein
MTTLALLFTLAASASQKEPVSIPWSTNFEAAKKVAATQKKPILVYFTTDWCGYCKVMEKESFGLSNVVEHAQKYVPVKLDAEKTGVSLANKLGVNAFPTFVILNAQEKELGRVKGYKSAKEYMAEIDLILAGDEPRTFWQARLKEKPNDGAANAEMAMILATEGKIEEAEPFIAKAMEVGFKSKPMSSVLLRVGRAYQRTSFEKSRDYLMKAIALRDPEIHNDAYDAIMAAAIYGNRREEMPAVAKLMVTDPMVSEENRNRARRSLLAEELKAELSTPDGLVSLLMKESHGQKNRDLQRFRLLFDRNAQVATVHNTPQGPLETVITLDTWLETLQYDKRNAKFEETSRSVTTNGILAHAWVEYRYQVDQNDGTPFKARGRLSIVMIASSSRWLIRSMIQETLKD